MALLFYFVGLSGTLLSGHPELASLGMFIISGAFVIKDGLTSKNQ